MKKIVSMFLVFALFFALLSVPHVSASDYSCRDYEECSRNGAQVYIITKENCAIRNKPSNSGKIVTRGHVGALVSVKKVFRTSKLTKWCELQTSDGSTLYIHIDNVSHHKVHEYVYVYNNTNGFLQMCHICGHMKAVSGRSVATCDLKCVGDQAIKGSFSRYDPSFTSIAANIAIGEIPIVGQIADIRDLIGDILNGERAWVIGVDLLAVLPLLGALKYTDELAFISKHTDDFTNVKYADDIALSAGLFEQASSSKLAKAMDNAYAFTKSDRYYNYSDYILPSRSVAAHHIVPGAAPEAAEARAILSGMGIPINSAENGVYLSMKADFNLSGAVHAGGHSTAYYTTVNERIVNAFTNAPLDYDAQKSAVISELDKIATELMTGKLALGN